MADLLTAAQKAALRASGHKSKFYMSVSEAPVLLTALVNDGAITRGEIAIAFDAGTSADPSLIRPGMMLEVQTTDGPELIRISTISTSGSSPTITGTINVDYNNIDWSNNDALSVYGVYQPVAIHPFFDATVGLSSARKRGQTYTNQNSQPPPHSDPGPNRSAFLNGATVTLSLNGTGTPMADGATITTYLWECTGGTIASSSSASTTIDFTVTGQFWLSLTVTDSNGKTHRSNRRIWIHDPTPGEADYPYTDFETSPITIEPGQGVRVSVVANGVADFDQFRDNTLVQIWAEDSYDNAPGSITLIQNGEGILFAGYIIGGTVLKDWQRGTVQFELGSVLVVAGKITLQALYLQAVASPGFWFQYAAKMTLDRMVWWFIVWHSNIAECASISWSGLTSYKKIYQWNESTILSQINDIAAKFRAIIGTDKTGGIHVEADVQLLSDAARAAVPIVSDITTDDTRNDIQIKRRHLKEISSNTVTGFFYDGVNVDTITPFQCVAPTKIRNTTGSGKQSIDGMVVASQADINELAGRFIARGNNRYEQVSIKFAGNYSVLDLFPQRWWRMSIAADDTSRGIEWTDVNLVPRSLTLTPDFQFGALLVDGVFEVEVAGPDGITIPYPGTPVCPPGSAGNTESPSPATEEQEEEVDYPNVALVVFQDAAVFKRERNDTTWTQIVTDSGIQHGKIDNFWYIRNNSYNPALLEYGYAGGTGTLEDVTGLAGTPVSTTPGTDPPNSWSDATPPDANTVAYIGRIYDVWNEDEQYILIRDSFGGNYRGWLLKRTSGGDSYLPLFDTGGAAPTQAYPIWFSVGVSHVLVTVWHDEGTDNVKLLSFTKSAFAFSAEFDLGLATIGEVTAFTVFAFPVATADYSASAPDATAPWYVAGRMINPVGLTGTYRALTYNGTTWSAIEMYDKGEERAFFTLDYICAMKVSPLEDDVRRLYACLAESNASTGFWPYQSRRVVGTECTFTNYILGENLEWDGSVYKMTAASYFGKFLPEPLKSSWDAVTVHFRIISATVSWSVKVELWRGDNSPWETMYDSQTYTSATYTMGACGSYASAVSGSRKYLGVKVYVENTPTVPVVHINRAVVTNHVFPAWDLRFYTGNTRLNYRSQTGTTRVNFDGLAIAGERVYLGQKDESDRVVAYADPPYTSWSDYSTGLGTTDEIVSFDAFPWLTPEDREGDKDAGDGGFKGGPSGRCT